MSNERFEPQTTVEVAAQCGMTAINDSLNAVGCEAATILVLIRAEGIPEGEEDSTAAGQGYTSGNDLLAALLEHATGVGKSLGVGIGIMPLSQVGQG